MNKNGTTNTICSTFCFLTLVLTCSSCATLSSREAAAGCQVADIASTHYALHHNPNAFEQNPMPVPLLDAIKLALAAYIQWGISKEDWEGSWSGLRAFFTVLGCGAAISNIRVGNQKP